MNEQFPLTHSLIDAYLNEHTRKNAPFFDEMVAPNGSVYPHWNKLVDRYNKMGKESLDKREQEVFHQLKENGVTYNIYGDPEGLNRPWMLDPVPMVFSESDWTIIEKGLNQRATLLNHILKDIYGDRKLIKSGVLPFELIFNHNGFLRQLDQVKIPFEQQLIQYSADLARGPDGKMWVLHDRTDAPSGAGYTFENRSAMTRVFPEMIRENGIRKINSYYQTLKNSLTQLAWQNKEDPHIVFLTPGTGNETYFEHAYLSSFMGFTLATGNDLTVSDGFVWLKTIKGLEKVDVIIRRVDNIYCDPLEFNMDSQLGVVGLMESVRQQKVMVINPLGSRVLENPGLMAFLPQLCQQILGEELILPSVATWWCGQAPEKEYVLENIRSLIIRKIYRDNTNKSIYGQHLTEYEISQLKDEINYSPYMYVGQEMVNFSTAPAYINGRFESRNAVFRSYVVADIEENSYFVMPGGMSRSSATEGIFIVSNQSGGISKDTWVLGKASTPKEKTQTVKEQVKYALPSSTAENLFWLGRYVERATFLVRFFRILLKRFNETEYPDRPEKDIVLSTLLQTLSYVTYTLPGFTDEKKLKSPENDIVSLITDKDHNGSLNQALYAFLQNGYSVRDRLGLDIWRILDKISEDTELLTRTYQFHSLSYVLDGLIVKLMAFHGLSVDTMTRQSSWNMQSIGRYIESSIKNASFIKNILAQNQPLEIERVLLESLLINNESLISYRYDYRSTLDVSNVLRMLLINELNPRSVIYQIAQLEKQVVRLPHISESFLDPVRKKLLEVNTMVRLCEPKIIAIANPTTGVREELTSFMDNIIYLLNEVSELISNKYFNHTESKYGFVTQKIPEI